MRQKRLPDDKLIFNTLRWGLMDTSHSGTGESFVIALRRRMSNAMKEFFETMQNFLYFSLRSFGAMVWAKRYWSDITTQMYFAGTASLAIVVVSSISIGSLLTMEVGNQLESFGAKTLTGRATALSVIREMAPMVTGLMLAARVGASFASELGAMKISEQIDALRAFGTDPIAKLVMPRLMASLIMFLPLTAVSSALGLLAGSFIAQGYHNIDAGFYWNSVLAPLEFHDFLVGFVKPPVFAVAITLVSCFNGFSATGGTVGVGQSTVKGIVVSSGLVLLLNFYISKLVLENL